MRVAPEFSTRPCGQTDGRRQAIRSRVQERTTQLERIIQHHYKAASGTTVGHDAFKRPLADEASSDGGDPSSVAARCSSADGQGGNRIGIERLFHLIGPAIGLE